MNEKVLAALKAMIQNDDTQQYIWEGITPGTIHENDDNYHWLEVLRDAQMAYYEATGEMVPNANDVLLLSNVPSSD